MATNTPKHTHVSSLDELAAVIGLSRRTMKEWKKREGFPPKEGNGYPVEKVRRFIRANRKDNAHRELTPEEKAAKTRLLLVKCEREELKLEQERGALVPATSAAEILGGILGRLRARFERMRETEPAKIAKLATPAEVEEHLFRMETDLFAEGRQWLENQKNATP